ncbi:hypothetical protein NEMBOFW57_000419 [Staphylotrichum longicolle]|uniref:DSBA-like thioredoxin domain-containing protein n=1 Tax=Staphylotrichum longicolle TaxID=669026 RepID=A0AAD4HX29_9PEZI|nr:hypothetical protein NEMBOFW57_000419 [Staphylotrichum longicolle]
MGGKKIDCYLDLASLYSYLTFLELQKNHDLLASHNVEVEYHPVLLGAINAGSAVYGTYDARRSIARHAPLPISFPKDLMKNGKTVVVRTLPPIIHPGWADVPAGFAGPTTTPAPAARRGRGRKGEEAVVVHGGAGPSDRRGPTEGEEMKSALKRVTQEALDKGAFGAPWLWVSDGNGGEEPFFGSDRFHFVYEFLGLPYTGVTLLPAGEVKGKL